MLLPQNARVTQFWSLSGWTNIAARGYNRSLRLGYTTSKNAAAMQGEPLLALCFGIARVLDHSLCFFTYSDKLVAQLNGCTNFTSQSYARMR